MKSFFILFSITASAFAQSSPPAWESTPSCQTYLRFVVVEGAAQNPADIEYAKADCFKYYVAYSADERARTYRRCLVSPSAGTPLELAWNQKNPYKMQFADRDVACSGNGQAESTNRANRLHNAENQFNISLATQIRNFRHDHAGAAAASELRGRVGRDRGSLDDSDFEHDPE